MNTPDFSFCIDLYELTMAQAYFKHNRTGTAYFEVYIRKFPPNWGYFVMAGLDEFYDYVKNFHFTVDEIRYLKSTKYFTGDFLKFLSDSKPQAKIRSLPAGTIFFPDEPVVEIEGPLFDCQLLESYCLNILGSSIIHTTLASRIVHAAGGRDVIDFGLRRSQGPIAALRAARAAQIAGFRATSNLFAAKLLNFPASGTMAHSFVEVHEDEKLAFENFASLYGENAILLVDTFDVYEGIKKAAVVAKEILEKTGVKIKGIRLDSGDLLAQSKFAREHFDKDDVPFLKIYASGDLDEFKIYELTSENAPIDGFGVGTRFAVSWYEPALSIVYKIVQFGDRKLAKTSEEKGHFPGRKSITRIKEKVFVKDIVSPFDRAKEDLLVEFKGPEDLSTIQNRLKYQLSRLEDSVKQISSPAAYPVEFAF
jgi:nicotinate phosphoribosyltransferase